MKVPRGQRRAVLAFLRLPEDKVQALTRAVGAGSPSFLLSDLAKQVHSQAGLSLQEAREVLSLFGILYLVREQDSKSLDEFVEEVLAAFKDLLEEESRDAAEGKSSGSLPAPTWDRVKEALSGLLSLDTTLGLSAKALDVAREQQRFFCDARVMTDVRPVFKPGTANELGATILLHQLRIRFHEDSDLREFYITLSPKDVLDLKRSLERAFAKEAALLSAAAKLGVPCLTPQELVDE